MDMDKKSQDNAKIYKIFILFNNNKDKVVKQP